MSRDELKEVLEAILEELRFIRHNTSQIIQWPPTETTGEPEKKQKIWPRPGPTIVYGIGE